MFDLLSVTQFYRQGGELLILILVSSHVVLLVSTIFSERVNLSRLNYFLVSIAAAVIPFVVTKLLLISSLAMEWSVGGLLTALCSIGLIFLLPLIVSSARPHSS